MSDLNHTKQCSDCKSIKPLSEFHKDSSRRDGLNYKCKPCNILFVAAYKKTDKGKLKEAAYQKTDAGKLSVANYQAKNPIKRKATEIISYAVLTGRLLKPDNCEQCSNTGLLQGHHDDYALPLVVRWLCVPCHNLWHTANGAGLNG